MAIPYAAGEFFTITLDGARAVVTILRRPDLPASEGARDAEQVSRHVKELARRVKSLLIDLREAPPVSGPKTTETVGGLLGECERAGVRVAVLLTGDPLQLLQMRRLVTTHAPTRGFAALTQDEASAWLAPPSPRR